MNFAEIIKKVNKDTRLVPDLKKAENGKNFRAVSESAILDVINPILEEEEVFYAIEVKDQHLDIREAYGSKGKKLQFIATVAVKIKFFYLNCGDNAYSTALAETESVGMGIDDNDKAMGKAYTYAIKYGLLKLFRLRYGDDPDAEASETLYTDKPKEKEPEHKAENKTSKSKSKAMTENQRDYILGMMKQKDISASAIMGRFDGLDPTRDDYIPMQTARAMIKWLEEQEEDLPF